MTAVQVAQAIINEAKKQNIELNSTKLQKLLYIVYGFYLADNKEPIFSDDIPLCLPYGPVFDGVYTYYKTHNMICNQTNPITDSSVLKIITNTIKFYGEYSAAVLSRWSHREGGAWSKTDKLSSFWGVPLKEEDIITEFTLLLQQLSGD